MPKSKGSILVVDDSADTLEVLERNLAADGYQVATAKGVREAVAILDEQPIDLVITDLKMPHISGLDLVRHVRQNATDTVVLMITGYPSVEAAVQAVKLGAEDFLPKPFTDDELTRAVQGAFEKLRSRRTIEGAQSVAMLKPGLIGDSLSLRRVLRAIERLASVDNPVLIVGEPGSGKELAARTIHYSGGRAGEPFIVAQLGSIPPEQAEKEVMGGTGTGSGLLQAAAGGTLYLDDIDQAPNGLQRVLVQCLRELPARAARLIAATSKNLSALVKRGAFREDLFYLCSATTLEVPPLRERGDDILALVQNFASKVASRAGRPVPRFSDNAVEALRTYSWPGNVRELQSVIERLVLLAGTDGVDVTDLPALMRFSVLRDRAPLQTLAEVETEYIARVLLAVDGNRSKAAEVLGVDRKTLREKMKRAAAGPVPEDESP